MSPDFRKVALIAGVLGLLVSLFIALRPDDKVAVAPTTTAATTTRAVTPTIEAKPGPAILDVDARTGEVARLSVEQGDHVLLNVTADIADRVHLHGYDVMADVAPGRPAKISFTADAAGRFEIELEESGLQIAELEVRP